MPRQPARFRSARAAPRLLIGRRRPIGGTPPIPRDLAADGRGGPAQRAANRAQGSALCEISSDLLPLCRCQGKRGSQPRPWGDAAPSADVVVDGTRAAMERSRDLIQRLAPPPSLPQLIPFVLGHPRPTHTHNPSAAVWCRVDRLNSPHLCLRNGPKTGGVPSGIRTRVSALKGPRPDPWTMGTRQAGPAGRRAAHEV